MGDTAKNQGNQLQNERRGRYTVHYTDWSRQCILNQEPQGLPNDGEVLCFRNSALTALVHLPIFVNWLDSHMREPCVLSSQGGSCPICHLGSFALAYWPPDTRDPHMLYNRLSTIWQANRKTFWKDYSVDQHQDVQEYLTRLLQELEHASIYNAAGPVTRMFQSKLKLRDTCGNCSHTRDTADYSYTLGANPLDKGTRTIREGIGDHLGEQKIPGYSCENCNQKVTLVRRTLIDDAPEVLIVHINRFRTIAQNRSSRLSTKLTFEKELDLTEYLDDDVARTEGPLNYKLCAIVTHKGTSVSAGHYVCFVQGPMGNWSRVDDKKVTSIGKDEVLRCHQGQQIPYLLIYTREPRCQSVPNIDHESSLGSLFVDSQVSHFSLSQPDPPSTCAANESDANIEDEPEESTPNLDDSTNLLEPGDDESAIDAGESPSPKRPNRWVGQPAEIMVKVTMGDMVLTGGLKGILKQDFKISGSRKSPNGKPKGVTKRGVMSRRKRR